MTLKSTLHVRLFGSLELLQNDEPLSIPSSAKARWMLAYMTLNHDCLIPRDRLVGIFWPERPDSRARRALSNALWQIRRALGPTADRLETQQDALTFVLGPGDRLDVEEFEEKANLYPSRQVNGSLPSASLSSLVLELTEAVALYRADFLEECYDDWALLERERLRELYLRALEQLIILHKQAGDYERALADAQRLTAADPLREAAHRELMRLYHLLGRPQAALKQFAALRDLLTKELGVIPTQASTTLYQEIIAAMEANTHPHLPVAPPPPPLLHHLARLPFVGRADERAELLSTLQAAARGHGGLVLIEGDAGIGKTRLVHQVVADAEWRGFQVGSSKADPLAVSAPYQMLRDALDPLLTPLRVAQLSDLIEPLWLSAVTPLAPAITRDRPDLPPLAPVEPHAERRRLWEGLTHCLAGLASITPLLLVLEDLHWADEATLALLPHLAPRLTTHRALLVITCRTAEAREQATIWHTLETLDRALPFLKVQLAPFESPESLTFIQRMLGLARTDASIAAFARRLHDETGGNPLFLVESLKSLLEQNALRPSPDGRWLFPPADQPLPTPASVESLVHERMNRLSSNLRATLELVAVTGADADLAVLSQASALRPAELFDQLEALCRHGFLVKTTTGYRLEHDLVRGVVYQAIPPQRQQTAHRRAGNALEALYPGRIEALARHFDRGGDRERALTYTMQAGERAKMVYDYETALAYYRRASELVDNISFARWKTLEHQNQLLYTLSRWEAAAQVLDEMMRLAEALDDPLYRAYTLYLAGRQEKDIGDPRRALTLLEKALHLARTGANHPLVGNILTVISYVYWRLGDVSHCQAAAEQALTTFREAGDRDGERLALNALDSLHLGLIGDYGQALACSEESRRIAHELGNAHAEAIAQGNSAIALSLLGDYQAAQRTLTAALAFAAAVGDQYTESAFYVFQGINHRGLGDLEAARQSGQRALEICRQVNNSNFEIEALGLLGLVALDQGTLREAQHWFEQAVERSETLAQVQDRAAQLSHLALVHSRLGDHQTALDLSTQALAVIEREPEMSERLKTAHFERAQIVNTAYGSQAARHHLKRAHRSLMHAASRISDSELRRSFLERVSENRAIVTAYQIGRIPSSPRRQTVRLPAISTSTGRPLRDDEFVVVAWTVTLPEDDAIPNRAARRRRRLLRLLREAAAQFAAPTVAALATALDVSERTVKRDLAALRAAGHDVSTRGTPTPTS